MYKKVSIFIFIFILLSFKNLIFSQKIIQDSTFTGEFPFTFYGIDEGLPQEEVLSIFQDNEGYMWFGTYSGLAKYNGRKMEIFTDENGLASNSIFDINQDIDSNLYFATLKGISQFKNDSFINYFTDYQFKNIFIDKNNCKWFYNESNIFLLTAENQQVNFVENYHFEDKIIHKIDCNSDSSKIFIATDIGFFVSDEFNISKISDDDFKTFEFIDSNKFYAANNDGIFKYAIEKNELKIIEKLNFTNISILDIEKNKSDNSLIFKAKYNAYQLTAEGKLYTFDNKSGLKNFELYTVFSDNEKNLWFGFVGGIQKLSWFALRNIKEENTESYVTTLHEDILGRIWFVVGNQVAYIDDEFHFFTDDFLTVNEVFSVNLLSNNNILLITDIGVYEFDVNTLDIVKKNMFYDVIISYIETSYVSSKDEIFIQCGAEGIIYYLKDFYSQPVEIINDYTTNVYQLIEFEDKIIGANNTGLVYYNNNSFESLLDLDDAAWGFCIENDFLWVGTEGGLGIYKNDDFEYFANDIINDDVNSICLAKDTNFLWLGKNNGIYYFDKQNHEFVFSLNKTDGLPGAEISIEGLLLDKKALLWIGTFHGISTFNLDDLNHNIGKPKLKIEYNLNGNKIKDLPSQLKYFENNILFTLTAFSFKNEKMIEYDFFLEGLENDYNKSIGSEFKAFYQNLPPGNYTFNFRAKNTIGIWTDFQKINFTILKPFWLKWWFILLSITIIALFIILLVKWRINVLKNQNLKLEEIIKDRTKEITFQKNQILEQNEELQQQKEELETTTDMLKKANYELEQLSIVARETDNAILIADKKGKIEWFNYGFEKIYGYTLDDLKNSKISYINELSSNPKINELINLCVTQKKSVNYIEQNVNTYGKLLWMQTTLTPIIDEEGNVNKLITIDTDISKLKKAEEEINIQKDILEQQNKNITDSINYALTIQNAILPDIQLLNNKFEIFVIYKPKDIVSGDFYWCQCVENETFLAVVDCTGHGVPGAFMSLISSRLIDEIIINNKVTELNQILEYLDEQIFTTLKQESKNNTDGFDISIIKIVQEEEERISVEFAGAKMPILLYNSKLNTIEKIPADRRSIGGNRLRTSKLPFTKKIINPNKNDIIYLYSDGIIDQNNFERKRFGTKKLIGILENCSQEKMEKQKEIIQKSFDEYSKDCEQRDDITIFGIRF